LQSLSGWHKSFIPFLLQNIGWFIGILCFISGSIFFVSYTEGFSKSVTIFYTILSYTLLLAWAGYHLKEKVTHASTSGMVLLAISFLLVPLNFSAAGRLLSISLENSFSGVQFIIAIISVLTAMVLLYYLTRLISGLFNRQLLNNFSPIFFLLSAIQLVVPFLNTNIHSSQNLTLVLGLFALIMALLLSAIVNYLPVILKQVFVDKKYLLLFSVGSLIFSAVISMIHISLSSPVNIALSYYAPVLLLISAVLFYMDEQLNAYREKGSLLSYLSVVSYALSFAAIFLSFDSSSIRLITITLSLAVYARLMWLYRSLVPLYLVIVLTCFLYIDILLTNDKFILSISQAWLYISLLPLLMLLSAIFYLLRNSELQREKSFLLTRHLLHFIIISSVLSALSSHWAIHTGELALINGLVVIVSLYYLLKSKVVNAVDLLGINVNTFYTYVLTMLAVIMILSTGIISTEMKLILLTTITLFYSLNSHYSWLRINHSNENKRLERTVFTNSSLIVSLLLIILIGLGFSISIKISLLLFVISLNTLFISMSLYNRALFYIFMLLLSLSALIFKVTINSSTSTGLLLISLVFLLFYFISVLEKNKNTEQEIIRSNNIHQKTPDKLLWFYPVNDLAEHLITVNEEGATNV
ncbi:MAG: hypothetical protein GQ546_06105, partial [Gammaproteobacteria bacterium]|nr:hypothetical protein [Gammaproteobacteria bacterium]